MIQNEFGKLRSQVFTTILVNRPSQRAIVIGSKGKNIDIIRIQAKAKLEKLISCSFKVVNQVAGIRPTVKDRRPLVGRHSTYKNMDVLNGLGTRGVMIAPYAAQQLFNHIEKQEFIRMMSRFNRKKGEGRPTKKERRDLDDFTEE